MGNKKPSKRLKSKTKYKIVKKVAEHNRKQKKEIRKKGLVKRQEKLIEIPSKCPFKEELQAEAELRREQVKTEKAEKRKQLRDIKRDPTKKRTVAPSDILFSENAVKAKEPLAIDPHQYVVEHKDLIGDKADKSTRAFASEVRRTIEAADIVIEVLDARDPLGSRNRSVEQSVISQGKRLILLLNKIDLVPKSNVSAWLKYLRQELPTIAFKASTQEQARNLGHFSKTHLLKDFHGGKCVGADLVMGILNNYCRNKDIKTSVKVGIIGYPNVGKSSVINSLKRRRACQTGATPGVTRKLQEVDIDKHVRLIDSPGVVLASREQFDPVEMALKNAIRVESLQDPVSPVVAILRRCSVETLMLHYNIPKFSDVDHFLALVANKIGRLKKGGRPDMTAAARAVLNAWNSGKLRYYTQPPEKPPEDSVCTSELLAAFSKEFNLNDVDDNLVMEGIEEEPLQVNVAYNPTLPEIDLTVEDDVEMDDDDDEDDETEAEKKTGKVKVVASKGSNAKKSIIGKEKAAIALPQSLSITGNVQLNKAISSAVKKNKKAQKKIAKRADKMGDKLASLMSGGGDVEMEEAYNFGVLDE